MGDQVWPDVRSSVDDMVGLGGLPRHGLCQYLLRHGFVCPGGVAPFHRLEFPQGSQCR